MSKFQDFEGPVQKFKDFPDLESKFSNSRTFQVFKDLYGTLCYKTMIATNTLIFAYILKDVTLKATDKPVITFVRCAILYL